MIDNIQASLIVAFGSMKSDLSSWRQTEIMNGYLQAVRTPQMNPQNLSFNTIDLFPDLAASSQTLFRSDFLINSNVESDHSWFNRTAAEADASV